MSATINHVAKLLLNKTKGQRVLQAVFASLLVGILSGCGASGNKPNVELIQDMMESPALKAQDFLPWDREATSQLQPPPGTVARGQLPYMYPNDPIEAEKKLKNPMAGDFSPETLARGKKRYDINCAVCHGDRGAGDGQIASKMALKPPSLLSDKVRTFLDGRIFHIITAGQGVMGAYADNLTKEEDRWAIVNYVRDLQKGSNSASAAKESESPKIAQAQKSSGG